MPQFERYLGIDYSGAQSPTSSLDGLRVYAAAPARPSAEIPPPPSARKYWTRRGLAEWLALELQDGPPTLVGIDHAFSFPQRYFEAHGLPPDWPHFLKDFQHHWPTDGDVWVRDVRSTSGRAREGDPTWFRLTETRSPSAKSTFRFGVHGEVASSTHAGLPWLRYLCQHLGERVHFWPFDGWTPPPGRSVITEVYPALWKRRFPQDDRNAHQHDAYSVACWMQQSDAADTLRGYFAPHLQADEQTRAQVEGWILGVP